MRSLAKNLTLLNDIIVTFKKVPDIIAISETKLNDNYVSNISIPGHSFLNTNLKTSAGGVGLSLADQLNFIRRHDLELPVKGVESCWIETMLTVPCTNYIPLISLIFFFLHMYPFLFFMLT